MTDIALYTPGADGIGIQAMVSGVSGGRLIDGPEKLAQRFLLKLLHTPASSAYFKDGCNFLQNLNANVMTELDIFTSFSSALAEIDPMLRSEESDDTPDNERFTGAAIIELVLSEGNATISVAVFNRAGTAIGIRLPMEVT